MKRVFVNLLGVFAAITLVAAIIAFFLESPDLTMFTFSMAGLGILFTVCWRAGEYALAHEPTPSNVRELETLPQDKARHIAEEGSLEQEEQNLL